jgi:hypothetical protein
MASEILAEQLIRAFKKHIPNPPVMEALRCAYNAPYEAALSGEMARAAGWNVNSLNLQLGKYTHKICDELGYMPEEEIWGAPFWTGVLGYMLKAEDGSYLLPMQFRMHTEVRKAFDKLGWLKAR